MVIERFRRKSTRHQLNPESSRAHHDRTAALHPELQGDVNTINTVSYTHLRAHETVLDLVSRLLLEKKKYYYRHDYTA